MIEPQKRAREQFANAVTQAALLLWDAMAPESAPKTDVLTPEQVAGELAVSEAQVTKLCRSKSLKAMKVGKLWRIPRAELERFKNRRLG